MEYINKPVGWSSKIPHPHRACPFVKMAARGLNPWTPARLMVEWEPPTFFSVHGEPCGVSRRSSTFWFGFEGDVWWFFFCWIGIPWDSSPFCTTILELFPSSLSTNRLQKWHGTGRVFDWSNYAVVWGFLGPWKWKKSSAKQLKNHALK